MRAPTNTIILLGLLLSRKSQQVTVRFRSLEHCLGFGNGAIVISGAPRAMNRNWMRRNVFDKFEGLRILRFDKTFLLHKHLICRDVEM